MRWTPLLTFAPSHCCSCLGHLVLGALKQVGLVVKPRDVGAASRFVGGCSACRSSMKRAAGSSGTLVHCEIRVVESSAC